MPVFAELHDGRRLEFPDGTDPGVVQATVKKLMAQASAVPQAAQAPEEGMGQAALIAAGRGTDKVVQGVRQAYNWATGDQTTLDQMAADEAEKDKAYKPLQDKFPITTGIAETAPALAAFPIGGGASLLKAGASAALPSLLSYGTAEERLKRGATDAVFGAAGAGGGKVLAKVLKPAGVGTEAVSNTAIEAAERVGFKPLPSQIANNPAMANFENYLLRTPGSSGTMQKVVQSNQTALNKTAAKAMGETAETLDEGVFGAASQRIGGEFDRLSAATKPQLGDDFINSLAKIEGQNSAKGPFASKEVTKLIDKGLDLAAKGNLDGKAYKEIRTELANQAQAAFRGGDATTGHAYKTVVSALDDAAKASLSPADRKAWDMARKEWGAFKTLSKSNVAEAGNVSAARTAAAVRSQGPKFRAGQLDGEMADIARIGEAFKGVQNPNSGQLAQQMLFSNPLTGLPMLAANRAAAAVYMSPMGQRYFSRGLLDVGETGRSLLGRAGIHGAIPAGRGLLGTE
jgi:hypothetical protein